MISRVESKKNLNLVIEVSKRKVQNNDLFDKYWYMKREATANITPYNGWITDSFG